MLVKCIFPSTIIDQNEETMDRVIFSSYALDTIDPNEAVSSVVDIENMI